MTLEAADARAETRRRPGRPREARINDAVITATLTLIHELGVAGLSMHHVADEAGVSKSAIYRRWESKEALLLDALRSANQPPPVPNTGTLRADLERFLHTVIERYHTHTWHDILPHLIEAGHYDPALQAELDEYLRQRQQSLRSILLRAAERGELDTVASEDNLDVIVSAILGPLTYRMMLTHEPLDDRFVTTLLDIVLA